MLKSQHLQKYLINAEKPMVKTDADAKIKL